MPRRKKFELTAPMLFEHAGPSTTFSESLRSLLSGLFGAKKTYSPTPQEIADYYLTTREREIAYLAMLGFSDAEIGDALAINFQTVRTHLRTVLNKMDVDSPRELREYFLRQPPEK